MRHRFSFALFALALALALPGCKVVPAPSAGEDSAVQRSAADVKLDSVLANFGSSRAELDAFVQQADPALPNRILNGSRADALSDYTVVEGLQFVAAHLEVVKAPPARFQQLCDRLRFVVVGDSNYAYPYARVHENLCVRGAEAPATGDGLGR